MSKVEYPKIIDHRNIPPGESKFKRLVEEYPNWLFYWRHNLSGGRISKSLYIHLCKDQLYTKTPFVRTALKRHKGSEKMVCPMCKTKFPPIKTLNLSRFLQGFKK